MSGHESLVDLRARSIGTCLLSLLLVGCSSGQRRRVENPTTSASPSTSSTTSSLLTTSPVVAGTTIAPPTTPATVPRGLSSTLQPPLTTASPHAQAPMMLTSQDANRTIDVTVGTVLNVRLAATPGETFTIPYSGTISLTVFLAVLVSRFRRLGIGRRR